MTDPERFQQILEEEDQLDQLFTRIRTIGEAFAHNTQEHDRITREARAVTREAVDRYGIAQTELARRFGVNRTTIRDWLGILRSTQKTAHKKRNTP